jgi:hypothetical protein
MTLRSPEDGLGRLTLTLNAVEATARWNDPRLTPRRLFFFPGPCRLC